MSTSKCPYCGGEVLYMSTSVVDGVERGMFVYVCENFLKRWNGVPECNTYVYAHQTNAYGNMGEPKGVLANLELRNIHREANEALYKLWSEKIIHKIMGYIYSYKDDEGGVRYCEWIGSNNGLETVKFVDTDLIITVPPERLETIKPRTKAYLWLSLQMGTPITPIGYMDYETTIKAINIITNELNKFK